MDMKFAPRHIRNAVRRGFIAGFRGTVKQPDARLACHWFHSGWREGLQAATWATVAGARARLQVVAPNIAGTDAAWLSGQDVAVDDQGSIVLLRPISAAADAWINEHVEVQQTWGDSIVVEHRFADAIIDGMIADGLEVA